MPKLFTNRHKKIAAPEHTPVSGFCTNSYDSYLKQRVLEDNVPSSEIKGLTKEFKVKIADPLHVMNPNLEMGEYFVVPVCEIRQMLGLPPDYPESDKAGKPNFIHICNALRTMANSAGEQKVYPVTILVPIEKVISGGTETYKVSDRADSIYIESYPCPPDPRCPTKNELIGVILEGNAVINSFNSLL